MNKLICIVGMCGAGKSVIADELVARGYGYVRFGQLTMDIIKEQGLEVTETVEKEVRESLRAEHGMGAYAKLNIPKFDLLLKKGNVVGDGLYSWTEYKILKEHFQEQLIVICVYAPPKIRYARLSERKHNADDVAIRNRMLSIQDAKKRDYAEIENIEKGGPIAMADYIVNNSGSEENSLKQLAIILSELGE